MSVGVYIRELDKGTTNTVSRTATVAIQAMCTKIGSELSDVVELVSGIVQGSVLGPMMFLAYINELATILRKHGISVQLFADDVSKNSKRY